MKLRSYEPGYRSMISRVIVLFLLLLSLGAAAQPNLSIELKKPQKYENRELPAEKTGNKEFNASRRFYNDLVSRFNYYFNANNKLNSIVDSAKSLYREDYTQFLSFYNYSLDQTAMGMIDTVIYKCTAGILLHDLRSDWVDKLYLLMGKAYLYRKDFDSATNVFQYINYAFAQKDNGYDLPIGSNASNTNGVFTIATREKKSTWKRMMSFPPSRNESFLWQARTYIEQDLLTEAASLLELVRTDPNFPSRLQYDLDEMIAYVMYKQQLYEKSANHLLRALPNAANRFEKARWEYLAGQMYAKAYKDSLAMVQFEHSIQHTTDPLMEIYARLNVVSLAAGRQENALQKNLDELLKMAHREKYQLNRDIIYFAAAELELKRKNYAAAQTMLLNSVKYSISNPEQKQKSLLLLGDMNYTRKEYGLAHQFYDSIMIPLLKETDQQRVTERKPALKIISANQDIVSREDSLQKIALMPEEERLAFIKKVLKQLRKEKGLKDAANDQQLYPGTTATPTTALPTDLFGSNMAEFYFLNTSLKAKGVGDFKSQWGNRPNVDNWRRQTAVNNSLTVIAPTGADKKQQLGNITKDEPKELSLASMSRDIPLTIAQKDSSNRAIMKALLANAYTFQNQLEDMPSAIETYLEIIKRFPESSEVELALFNLNYCYKKNGQPEKADSAVAALKQSFPKGKMADKINTAQLKSEKKTDPAEIQYTNIYNMFLAGKFEEAKEAKLQADKQFGKSYWTPQLLFIESIYYIKQREDSTAINRLQNIVSLFPKSPLAAKATTMIDVLKRRSQIENYLTNLNVERPTDMVERRVDMNSTGTLASAAAPKKDTAGSIPKQIQAAPQKLVDLTDTKTIAAATAIKKDSISQLPKLPLKKLDISNDVKTSAANNTNYFFDPADTVYVSVVLDKVDPIFISEGRNAFNRYNQDSWSSQKLGINTRKINGQYQFLLIGPFENAKEALNYIDKTRPLAKTRIVPWLTADKYSFLLISNYNLNILAPKEDVDGYRNFIRQIFPDKF